MRNFGLNITVKHGEEAFCYLWTGEVTMQSEKYGGVVWQYIAPDTMRHFYGFKKLIVEEDFNTIILIGETDKGFGKEVLKRHKGEMA